MTPSVISVNIHHFLKFALKKKLNLVGETAEMNPGSRPKAKDLKTQTSFNT